MPDAPEPVIFPEALCTGNWSVLFENGEVFSVKYFLNKHREQLPTPKGAWGILVDGPQDKTFFIEISDIPIMSLH